MSGRSYIPVAATVQSNRIRIPALYADWPAWLKAQDTVEAWLFLIEPGRLRLLSSEQVENSPELKSLARRITDPGPPDPPVGPLDAEISPSAALPARLTPVTLSRTKGLGWRVTVPKLSFAMASIPSQEKVFFLVSDGYLEIWTHDRLTRALEVPFGELME